MSELKWEEPPVRRTRQGSGKHAGIAAQLRAKPGEWAIIDLFDESARAAAMAYVIKTAKLRAYAPAGAYEAKGRTVDGEHRVYARFVGGAER